MSPGLPFESKWEGVDNLITDDFLDITFDFIEPELPGEGEKLDLFFELKVNVTFFRALLKLVFGLVVTFREVAFKKIEHVLVALHNKSFCINLLVLLDFILAEFFNI